MGSENLKGSVGQLGSRPSWRSRLAWRGQQRVPLLLLRAQYPLVPCFLGGTLGAGAVRCGSVWVGVITGYSTDVAPFSLVLRSS